MLSSMKLIFEERLRFGIYRRVDPQSKTAQDLIDWHKLSPFCGRDFNDYRIKSPIEKSRFVTESAFRIYLIALAH